jgi:2,3-dihydroxyphenylpropionate 1,2-dioxygenase
LPLNPAWDRNFLLLLESGELARADLLTDAEISAHAGRGGHEIRAWVAALAALAASGPYCAETQFYQAIPAWIAGMAMLTASPSGEE